MRVGGWLAALLGAATVIRVVVACTGGDPPIVGAAPDASPTVTGSLPDVVAIPLDAALTPEAYRALVLQEQPTVYWRMASFDDAGVVVDERDASALRLESGAFEVTADDAFGPSIHFDGDAGFGLADRPELLQYAKGHAFTFEAWAKLDRIDSGTYNDIGSSATTATGGGADGYVLFWSNVAHRGDGALFFRDGTQAAAQDDVDRSATTWTLYDLVVDGLNNVKLYVNGALVPNIGTGRTATLDGSTTFTVGRSARAAVSYWIGNLAEIALYPQALTAEQVAVHARRVH